MIGKLEVQVQAHSPNMPLCPCFAFRGSPSSLRIMGVPKSIGAWRITEVYATLHYPDDVERTKLAVREGNVYVATLDGCQTTGKVENGLTISANGIDEDGNAVTGYVLGRGDVYVMEGDSIVPDPGVVKNYVKLCDSLPETPAKGDAFFQNGVLVIYDGTSWVPSADVHGDYIEDSNGNKIEADLDCYSVNLLSPWFYDSNKYTYDPTTQKWIWIEPDMGLDKQELTFYSGNNLWVLSFFTRQGDWDEWQQTTADGANGGANATELNFALAGMTFTRTVLEQGKLATEGYVNGIVGNINTVLDSINGEVI